ncbi:MAG TPA: hypothetical protein VGJ04_08105 [Pirellulales bacterium]
MKNKILISAIAVAVIAAAGWIVFGIFFHRAAQSQDIAWVLELTGKGWTLKGNFPRVLQVGDRLPAGGVIAPNSEDEATTITLCDFEGNVTRFLGRDHSQKLPEVSQAGLGAKLWRRIADSFEPKDVHAISRGDTDDHLNSSVVLQNDQGTVDLSSVLSSQAASSLSLRFKLLSPELLQEASSVKKSEIDWDPSKSGATRSPKLPPGLYSVEMQGADTGVDSKECLLLVCASNEFSLAEKEFSNCVAQINSWPAEIRDSLGEQNRRACVRALAGR